MATYTKNYNLKKPDATDYYNVGDMNENSDKIDTAIKEVYSSIPANIKTGTYVGNGEILRKITLDGEVDAIIVTAPGHPDTVTVSGIYQSFLLFNGGTASIDTPLEILAEPTEAGIKNGYKAYTLTALSVTNSGFLIGNDSITDPFFESNYVYVCNGKRYTAGSSFFSAQLNVTGRKYGYIAIMKK